MKLQIKKAGPTTQAVITIPRAIVKAKKWKAGTELDFVFGPHGEVILEETK